jgi:cytoskeletal protein CcmA (bactofilin family)
MSGSCPACSRQVNLGDVIVKDTHWGGGLRTCGRIVVLRRGRVVANEVIAVQGVEVQGVLEAKVVSGGPVRIGPRATWKGNCTAPSVKVDPGAVISGGEFDISDRFPDRSSPSEAPLERIGRM